MIFITTSKTLSPLSRSTLLPDTFPRTLYLSNFRGFELSKDYYLQLSNLSFCGYKVVFWPNPCCPSLMILAYGILWHLRLFMILAYGILWHLRLFGRRKNWVLGKDSLSQLFYADVVLFGGKFFAVDDYGRAVWVNPTSLEVPEVVPRMITRKGHVKRLVKSKGELLLVDRYPPKRRGRSGNKVEFRVYKLEIEHRRWVEVERLDDRILFFGQDCSFSLPARCFGSSHEGNCIVFADPVFMVFSLNDRKLSPIEQHPEYISIFYPPSL